MHSDSVVLIMVKNLGLLLSYLSADCRESPSDADNASDSLSAPFLEEAISDFPADCFKNNVKDFATDYLNRAECLSNNDEIVTEVVYTALSAEVSNNKVDISLCKCVEGR